LYREAVKIEEIEAKKKKEMNEDVDMITINSSWQKKKRFSLIFNENASNTLVQISFITKAFCNI